MVSQQGVPNILLLCFPFLNSMKYGSYLGLAAWTDWPRKYTIRITPCCSNVSVFQNRRADPHWWLIIFKSFCFFQIPLKQSWKQSQYLLNITFLSYTPEVVTNVKEMKHLGFINCASWNPSVHKKQLLSHEVSQ